MDFKYLIALFFGFFLSFTLTAQKPTIQERLGYSKDTKLLIIHADDLGVSQSENRATFYAMEHGAINSGSAMVPCAWFPEVAAYVKAHPEADIGLHLTLSSEWNLYRWDPVTDKVEVPDLIDEDGFFHAGWGGMPRDIDTGQIEKEIRAQVERSIHFGLNPTHLDPHMFQLFRNPEYLQVYLKIGHEYNIPLLLNKEMIQDFYQYDITPYLTDRDVVVDNIYGAFPNDYEQGMDQYYITVLKSLTPGLHYLYMHPSYDDPEMQAVTVDHKDWGAHWRQSDFNFFTSDTCKDLIESERIQLITWREIKEKLFDTHIRHE